MGGGKKKKSKGKQQRGSGPFRPHKRRKENPKSTTTTTTTTKHSFSSSTPKSNNHNHNYNYNHNASSVLLPLPFPAHLPRPKNDFLRNDYNNYKKNTKRGGGDGENGPFAESFRTALATSYEGFVVDTTVPNVDESEIQACLNTLVQNQVFRTDVTQPFGLGTKCAKTYVTRCLYGQPGNTYKYLGLRMFAYPWQTAPPIQHLANQLSQRTQNHLSTLDEKRRLRGATLTRGSHRFDICLINRMEPPSMLPDLKPEPTMQTSKTSVSWHADSSLEHYSTIAVYQTLQRQQQHRQTTKQTHTPNGDDDDDDDDDDHDDDDDSEAEDWFVALRVAHHSEGPNQSSRRGSGIESSLVKETPPIATSLPSGSAYYLLDDFNHHHQHAVCCCCKDNDNDNDNNNNNNNGNATSKAVKIKNKKDIVRYSCTFRLLRDSHNVEDILARCQSCIGNFHKKGPKLWRSEQLLLTELESEWIRQFYIQGTQHHRLLWPHWKESMQKLLHYWGQLETRTKQTLDLLRAAAEGHCGMATGNNNRNSECMPPSRADRKAREKRKKAMTTVQDLLGRTKNNATTASTAHTTTVASTLIYEPFAHLLDERMKMRNLWFKREKDHVFYDMEADCRPMELPLVFSSRAMDEESVHDGDYGKSPLPKDLKSIVTCLQLLGRAYDSKQAKDLPTITITDATTNIIKGTTQTHTHAKAFDWTGWTKHTFGLELQEPWAGAILNGEKTIETRLYDLPKALLGKRIMIIESPAGTAGKSSIGDLIEFENSRARIVGWCTFANVKKYTTQGAFESDETAHLVTPKSGYGWTPNSTKAIYGWVVGAFGRFDDGEDRERIRCLYPLGIRRMRSLFELTTKQSKPSNSERTQPTSGSGRKGTKQKKKKRKKRF